MMHASLLLWIAKAEILLTHYLTEGITRGFAGKKKKNRKKIQIPQTPAENYRNTLVSPVFQRNMKFWRKTDCWQISTGRFSYTAPVKMMLSKFKKRGGTSLVQRSGSWELKASRRSADWWDVLTGGQQHRHTCRETCTHTTPPRSSFPSVSTGLLGNLLVTSQNPAGHGNPTQRPACTLAVPLTGV